MRTYILALTRFPIAICMVVYTVTSVLQLRHIGSRNSLTEERRNHVQILMLFLIHFLGFFTIAVGMQDFKYMFFWLFQAIVFGASILIYRTLYPDSNRFLYTHVILMLVTGLIVLARLDFDKAVKQFFIAAIGMVIAIGVPFAMKKFRFLKRLTFIYAAIGIVALGIVLLVGQLTYGANLSFTVAGVTIQPSEFVKIIYVLFLASAYYEKPDRRTVLVTGLLSLIHVGILVLSKDLGSGLIYYMIFLLMTFLATGQWLWLAGGIGIGAGGALVCYKLFRHVQVRVQAWRDPWSVIETMGYQITQSLFSIASGGPFGLGLTQGTPDNIPTVESDFIFAPIAEELGLVFGMCIIAMCVVIFIHMLWLSLHFADRFYRLVSYGFAVSYIFQSFLTLGGESKFIPMTGVTLPLVSYGGSSVLSTIIMFSMVEAIFILQQDAHRIARRRFERRERERREGYGAEPAAGYEYREIPMRQRPAKSMQAGTERIPARQRPVRPAAKAPAWKQRQALAVKPVRKAPELQESYLDDGFTEDLPPIPESSTAGNAAAGARRDPAGTNRPDTDTAAGGWDRDVDDIDLSRFREVTFDEDDNARIGQ